MTATIERLATRHNIPESALWLIAAELYPVMTRIRPRLHGKMQMRLRRELLNRFVEEGFMGDISKSESRVRMNVSQNAKGLVQFDLTAEFPTPEESKRALAEAIDGVRQVCAEKGLKLADGAV